MVLYYLMLDSTMTNHGLYVDQRFQGFMFHDALEWLTKVDDLRCQWYHLFCFLSLFVHNILPLHLIVSNYWIIPVISLNFKEAYFLLLDISLISSVSGWSTTRSIPIDSVLDITSLTVGELSFLLTYHVQLERTSLIYRWCLVPWANLVRAHGLSHHRFRVLKFATWRDRLEALWIWQLLEFEACEPSRIPCWPSIVTVLH